MTVAAGFRDVFEAFLGAVVPFFLRLNDDVRDIGFRFFLQRYGKYGKMHCPADDDLSVWFDVGWVYLLSFLHF